MQGTKFTVKERKLTLGRQYRVFDERGILIAYVKQKLFRLRENIVFYQDESKSQILMELQAQKILDFNANLALSDANGQVLGMLRRKGWRSLLRDKWQLADSRGNFLATMAEDSWAAALFRRFGPLGALFPHRYHVGEVEDGPVLASIHERFQLIGDTYDITMHDAKLDPRLVIALTVLADSFEGE